MIIVYGYSDDLVYVKSGTRAFEFGMYDADGEEIEFDEGLVISATYDGEWSFEVVANPNDYDVRKAAGPEKVDAPDYSEELQIKTGPTPIPVDAEDAEVGHIPREW